MLAHMRPPCRATPSSCGPSLPRSYNYGPVMAGQGTIALEFLAQVGHVRMLLDVSVYTVLTTAPSRPHVCCCGRFRHAQSDPAWNIPGQYLSPWPGARACHACKRGGSVAPCSRAPP